MKQSYEANAAYNAAAYQPSLTQHEADLIALTQRTRELERQATRQSELSLFLAFIVLVLAVAEVFR